MTGQTTVELATVAALTGWFAATGAATAGPAGNRGRRQCGG
jgi:hypothetical protein